MLQQDRSCQGCLVSPWDPLKPGLWGQEEHCVLSWGQPAAASWCPQWAENSVMWTQEPAQFTPAPWGGGTQIPATCPGQQ